MDVVLGGQQLGRGGLVRLQPHARLQRGLRPQQEQERRHSPSRAGAGYQVTPH